MKAKVEQQERAIEALQKMAMPGVKIGDICRDLIDQQRGSSRFEEIQEQLKQFHCFDSIPAYADNLENNARIRLPEDSPIGAPTP